MKAALTPAPELYCSACEKMYPTGTGDVCPRDGTRLVKLGGQKDPFIGRDLDGRYLILDKLGQGGMGAVYRGNQRSVDREVAIKVVTPQLMSNPEMIKRFLREARLASRINHPNAVGVLDFGQTADGVFYLVMELVAGRTLESILDEEGKLDPDRTALIGAQICHALEGAHAVPIVHRDLKPANVIVDANDFVKVLDFGLAKSLSPDTISSTMTNAGQVMGTPNFMPPEVGAGRPSDARTDLYSLGCILYLTASGELPFQGETLPEIMMKHANEPAPPLPGVPPDLAAVILRLLAKNPDARYQTATATRLALEATIEGEHAPPTPWTDGSTIPIAARRGDELEAPTVPRKGLPVHERETLRPLARRAKWPWVVAAIAAGGIAAFVAINPFGGPTRDQAASPPIETAPVVPAQPPIASEPPAIAPPPSAIDTPKVAEPQPPVDAAEEIEMPAITATKPIPKPVIRSSAKPATKPATRPATKPTTKAEPDEPPPPPF